MPKLLRIDLGKTRYEKSLQLQKRLVSLRYQNKIPDCLLFTEHYPVITMGRGSSRKNLLASIDNLKERGIELFDVERGGDITFHGPGQTVVYPILDLNRTGRDIHKHLRNLENLIIMALEEIGLRAETKKGLTGVWINDHKIAAIGVAVSHWVSYHGLALNISTDLDYFRLIVPCGINEYQVGSIESMTEKKYEMVAINNILAEKFSILFNYEIERKDNISTLLSES